MKKFFRKYLSYLIFILIANLFIFALFTGKINTFVSKFFESIEDKTFDIRQEITSQHREPNRDIVIVGIDDITYEYVPGPFMRSLITIYLYIQHKDRKK